MRPYIIVLGNEKGGTGKSTIAMHLAVFLLVNGKKVGTIDVDARQGTFTRYFENRKIASKNNDVAMPEHLAILKSENDSVKEAFLQDKDAFEKAIQKMSSMEFIIVDTPGNDTFLSQVAHSYADTLITPLNDSFIDLDVLVKVDKENPKIFKPSIYAESVWNQRKERAKRGGKPIDWIVIRNRLSTLYTKNRKEVDIVLEALSKRIGFRLDTGFCERVIFKEMFLSGMTLLDLEKNGKNLNLSNIAARQELRQLINMIKIPGFQKF